MSETNNPTHVKCLIDDPDSGLFAQGVYETYTFEEDGGVIVLLDYGDVTLLHEGEWEAVVNEEEE